MTSSSEASGAVGVDREAVALAHFLNYLRNPDFILTTLQTNGVSAKEAFIRRATRYVAIPLTLIEGLPRLVHMAAPNEIEAIAVVSHPEFRRIFAPPLNNFLMSCLEIFLESYFVESYVKPDGTTYVSAEDWKRDHVRFAAQFATAFGRSVKDTENWVKKFSFQRLPDLEVLYRVVLSIDVTQFPKYDSIQILWKKRHLFTHRAGVFDQRFIDEFNVFHEADPSQHLPASALGTDAFLETIWVVDALGAVKEFVSFIAK